MSEVKIIYNGYPTIIQYQSSDNLKEILKRFKIKINAENENLVYLYNDEIIKDENISISKLSSEKEITILAYDSNNIPSNIKNLVKSDNVICPICKKSAILDEKDYQLIIYGCQNEHVTKNILINKFNEYQEIDYSKIICNNCNKNYSYNNEFYLCNICKINLCPICKSKHDNNHKIIKYKNKDYKCNIHNEKYNSYCNKCKRNICKICENKHNDHEIIYYDKLIIENEKIIKNMKEMKKEIDIFNNDIKEKINKLKLISENIEEYYNIINGIIEKYINSKKRNYQILININNIINKNNIINNIKNINNNNNKYDDIIEIYNKIYNNNNDDINNKNNEIIDINNNINNNIIIDININKIIDINNDDNIIIYKIDENKDEIKIFGKTFVENNKNKIKLEIEGKEYKLMEYYKIEKINKKNLEVKIIRIENITDISDMFYGCSSLSSLPDISKWNTNNVTDISWMFWGCSSLSSLPDISKWNTNNVTNMSYMFYGCSSLLHLPDISKWNTNNVIDITDMFYECSSLLNLPDLSKWNTDNVKYMSSMFSGCSSLSSLPDISKWNTNNVANMSWMFYGCLSLSNLPDISKWNTNNVFDISGMFYGCSSLSNLPDISKWNIDNVKDMNHMFYGCFNSLRIPE